MTFCEDCGEVHAYDYGDRVQLVQNPLVKGQVVGERNWGDEYNVRLIGILKTEWFNSIELEPDPEFLGPVGTKVTPDEGAPAVPDNVVHVDFKRAGGLH